MQICNIFKCSGKESTVNEKACQQQTNGIDCGVFTVVNLLHILTGADIGTTKIREDKMREIFYNASNLDTLKISKNLTVVT